MTITNYPMKKFLLKTLLLVLVFCFHNTLKAQDTLYRIDGRVQAVKIVEVNTNQIKYKNPEGQGGPMFVLSKTEVRKVVYSNGISENFSTAPAPMNTYSEDGWRENKKPDPLSTDFNKNFVSVSVVDYFAGSFTVAYEHFFNSGDYSIRIPLSVGFYTMGLNKFAELEDEFSGRQGYYRERKKFSSGFDCNYFPFGQGKVKYYVGPSFEFGYFDYMDETYTGTAPNYYVKETQPGSYQSLILQNGFLFQPSRNLNFSLSLGMGYTREKFIHNDILNKYPEDIYVTKSEQFAFRFGLSVGYRF